MQLKKAFVGAFLGVVLTFGYLHVPLLKSKPAEVALIQNQIIDPYVELHFVYDSNGAEQPFHGSGTVISLKGQKYILTAGHMFKSTDPLLRIEVVKDGHKTTAEYINSEYNVDQGMDACLIKPQDEAWLIPANFSFAKINVKNAEECYYIGTPAGYIHASLEKTLVSAIHPFCDMEEVQYYRINGNGFFGNSGGGFFVKRDGKWWLTGIVARKYTYAANGPMLVVKHKSVVNFLKFCLENL